MSSAPEPPRDEPSSLLPQTPMTRAIESFVRAIGRAASWVWAVLLAVVVSNVTLRYAFDSGRVEFEELQWHLYAVGILAGVAYCVVEDAHVRVDVLRERLRPRLQAWLEFYGIALLLLPFVGLIVVYGVPFVAESYSIGEVSPSPGGLPYRWAIKAALPLGFALLGLAAVARLVRVGCVLFGEASSDAERAG